LATARKLCANAASSPPQAKHFSPLRRSLKGGVTQMKLRDWFELLRIELKREEGQTMAEYGLLIALIAVVCILVITAVGTGIQGKFQEVVNAL
jgi:pilus assembly protein Flp/PilA